MSSEKSKKVDLTLHTFLTILVSFLMAADTATHHQLPGIAR